MQSLCAFPRLCWSVHLRKWVQASVLFSLAKRLSRRILRRKYLQLLQKPQVFQHKNLKIQSTWEPIQLSWWQLGCAQLLSINSLFRWGLGCKNQWGGSRSLSVHSPSSFGIRRNIWLRGSRFLYRTSWPDSQGQFRQKLRKRQERVLWNVSRCHWVSPNLWGLKPSLFLRGSRSRPFGLCTSSRYHCTWWGESQIYLGFLLKGVQAWDPKSASIDSLMRLLS